MSAHLGEESLEKLLQYAAVLAHNERVLNDLSEAKERSVTPGPPATAAVEEGADGTYYMVTLNGYRHIFGLGEMRNLVKACHGAGSAADAGPRLYAWLERERFDILRNSIIADEKDPSLSALWKIIVDTYTVK